VLQWINLQPVTEDRLVNLIHSAFRYVFALEIQDLLTSIPLFKDCRGLTK
jgi:hypothetical protein